MMPLEEFTKLVDRTLRDASGSGGCGVLFVMDYMYEHVASTLHRTLQQDEQRREMSVPSPEPQNAAPLLTTYLRTALSAQAMGHRGADSPIPQITIDVSDIPLVAMYLCVTASQAGMVLSFSNPQPAATISSENRGYPSKASAPTMVVTPEMEDRIKALKAEGELFKPVTYIYQAPNELDPTRLEALRLALQAAGHCPTDLRTSELVEITQQFYDFLTNKPEAKT